MCRVPRGSIDFRLKHAPIGPCAPLKLYNCRPWESSGPFWYLLGPFKLYNCRLWEHWALLAF